MTEVKKPGMDEKNIVIKLDELDRRMRELSECERRMKLRESELDRRSRLFNMQWKLLEHELLQLASDKEKFRKEKEFYNEVKKQNTEYDGTIYKIKPKMFFLGVHDELSLKKRYRDLLKLFHPDSMNGDVNAMQSINKEYEELKKAYSV